MPERPQNQSMVSIMNNFGERLRVLERLTFSGIEQTNPDYFRSYRWQSAFELVTGYGHRLFADRHGRLIYVRLERSTGDGETAAVVDIEHNDQTIFPGGVFPAVDAGLMLSPEMAPGAHPEFQRGDSFRVNILETGGGSGPLVVTYFYRMQTEDQGLNTV